ncbi:MAG: hypothetical protein M1819_001260 [Sarea resinae]|nr:MAG: hypothetical protein M1819_001260 [Sarea resinae]
MCTPDLFLFLLAVLFPPLPVWIKLGICSGASLLNLLLCCLGYLPGLLHAWYIISLHPDPGYEAVAQDPERGGGGGGEERRERRMDYGTTVAGNSAGSAADGNRAGGGVPPSYAEAVKGDHKVQH